MPMVLPAVSRSVTAAVYARFGETPRAPAQAEVTSCRKGCGIVVIILMIMGL
jgi:hypothetical protein